jgi:hypothetical protein
MITEVTQRRRDGQDVYRPAGETINPRHYEVARIDRETAKAFVEKHHYSGTYPAGRRMFGYFETKTGRHVGTAVFGNGGNNKTVTNVLPGEAVESHELLRFVLLDCVPGNGETHFLSPCFEALKREGFLGVVSMADPVPRTNSEDVTVFPGHIGTIYQAFNAFYTGTATARSKRLFPDGTVYDGRTIAKARSDKKGWRYAAEQLFEHGLSKGITPVPESLAERRRWVDYWLPKVTDELDHPGNYRYVWGLTWTVRRHVRKLFPPQLDCYKYPKVRIAPSAQIALF